VNNSIDNVSNAISAHGGVTADMNGNVTGAEVGLGGGANMEAAVQNTIVCSLRDWSCK